MAQYDKLINLGLLSQFLTKAKATFAPKITASGILKGDGQGGVTAAEAGVDYATPSQIPSVPSASTSSPLMDGTATYGSGTAYARANHRHPTDTTRVAVAQGVTNKGKFLAVGDDGNVTLATINSAGGVSF